jgi:hypothetical protein
VLTQVWPVVYDQAQVLRIIGEDDDPSFVRVDPEQQIGYTERRDLQGKKIVTINPGIGKYDVRATVGPAFQTRQVEAAAELGEMVNGNPQLMAILGDVWVKMRNFPEAEKIARRLKAMLPPQVQQAEEEEEGAPQIPPQVTAILQQAQQEIQMLQQQLQEAQSGMAAKQLDAQVKMAQIESSERIEASKQHAAFALEAIRDDQKRDGEALRAWLAIVVKKMDETQNAMQLLQQSSQQMQTAPENDADAGDKPESQSPDMALILADALGRIGAPRKRKVTIQAPSGQVYQGGIEDDDGESQ